MSSLKIAIQRIINTPTDQLQELVLKAVPSVLPECTPTDKMDIPLLLPQAIKMTLAFLLSECEAVEHQMRQQ